jgi:hypothetical protein
MVCRYFETWSMRQVHKCTYYNRTKPIRTLDLREGFNCVTCENYLEPIKNPLKECWSCNQLYHKPTTPGQWEFACRNEGDYTRILGLGYCPTNALYRNTQKKNRFSDLIE